MNNLDLYAYKNLDMDCAKIFLGIRILKFFIDSFKETRKGTMQANEGSITGYFHF